MLDRAFADGILTDPGAGPGSLDLFRALAALCGVERADLGPDGRALVEEIGESEHYLFVLVDGLGINQTANFPPGGFFETTFRRELHSVFPSATAVALTSLATCESPATHGVTGWHTYYPEYSRVMTPLLYAERGTGYRGSALGLEVDDLVNGRVQVTGFRRRSCAFLPQHITEGYAVWARGGVNMSPTFTTSTFSGSVLPVLVWASILLNVSISSSTMTSSCMEEYSKPSIWSSSVVIQS